MSKLSNIPTNIITGFLGVGKTTAINSLLKQKPEDETWAILVNEFGQIGIDQVAMNTSDQEGLAIKELVGGCICCALGPALTSTLTTLIRRTKPDRLIIEPTGVGHPAGIIDSLQSDQFKKVLDLRSVICLLDPRALSSPEINNHPTFRDQLNLADIVLLSKTDLCEQTEVEQAREFSESLYPAKQLIKENREAVLNIELLDRVRTDNLVSEFPDAHNHEKQVAVESSVSTTPSLMFQITPSKGQPLSKTGAGNGMFSCGWVFSSEDRFVSHSLFEYLDSLNMQRIKGVFHTDRGWLFYNRVATETEISEIAYRRDSRVEFISEQDENWNAIEAQIKAFLAS